MTTADQTPAPRKKTGRRPGPADTRRTVLEAARVEFAARGYENSLAGGPAPAIRIAGLTVTRGGRPVLHDLDLGVATGSITGLLGPSGCGKTTLLRSIVGVQKVAAGRVEVLGEPAGGAALRHRVGYVTQAPSVYGDLLGAATLRRRTA
ncbi:ABC-type molybdenum transport system ATPase subunit/photorepair protein PhrA [Kitasatospora sp. MAP5-34]|nr:ABC-type molybdenum transport system ATPase subunit/photorepair protein PhrA [Kitasatospora sp. MAP5-34]